ncbi:MAG: hypothetical protein N3D84_03590 [Candidatus Woesearchaeota archaeon]|nr:hypothetical protein [Candidatus Woesearchaeota archaeon]
MRGHNFAFASIIALTIFSFALLIIRLKESNITGYSVLESQGGPVYISTFIILSITLVFAILIIAGFSIASKNKGLSEQELIRNAIKNMKRRP